MPDYQYLQDLNQEIIASLIYAITQLNFNLQCRNSIQRFVNRTSQNLISLAFAALGPSTCTSAIDTYLLSRFAFSVSSHS